MDSHKLIVKFFLEDPAAVARKQFVPVFHRFIQTGAIPDHLLIDVADYEHVHQGPGTVLVSHEAIFYLDNHEGRPGLTYQRKQPVPGATSLRERLAHVVAATLRPAALLEDEPTFEGGLRFRTDEIVFRVNDRLLAPNTPETFHAIEPELRPFLSDLCGNLPLTLEPRHSPQTLFEVRVTGARNLPVKELLARAETLVPDAAPAR